MVLFNYGPEDVVVPLFKQPWQDFEAAVGDRVAQLILECLGTERMQKLRGTKRYCSWLRLC